MAENYEELYQQRKTRIETALACGEPDTVPNVIRIGAYPFLHAGMTSAESMVEHEKACRYTYDFYAEPRHMKTIDAAHPSNNMPSAKALEHTGIKTARWPGDPKGLSVDNTYQYIETEMMHEDEYDEFFDHPAEFFFTKILPRNFEPLEFLADLDYYSVMGDLGQSFLTSPDKIPIYRNFLAAAEDCQRMMAATAENRKKLRAIGYYDITGGGSSHAFDLLGDKLRCTFGMMPDMIFHREEIRRAIEVFYRVWINGCLSFCKKTGSKYAWVMLHKGFDHFISDEDYAELYWPYLQRWILDLIDHGITPVVYTEGPYTTRLKYLKDVPPHKVLYHFEEVDLAKAKKELGDVACIMGGYPVPDVTFGTPDKIREGVKRLLDIMAPGGGYLFTTTYSIMSDCPEENIEAMLETVREFGKY